MNALVEEIKTVAEQVNKNDHVHTVFFGGGTPSLVPLEFFEGVLVTIQTCFLVQPDVEITLEANPGTVTKDYLHGLKQLGFTRISFGMQSANAADLRILERQHDFQEVEQSVIWAKEAGFSHINLDLIFGIPGQTLESWIKSLKAAIELGVDHLSLYSLTIERRTPLEQAILNGSIQSPDPDVAASMYEHAIKHLPKGGFNQYEISNWAAGDLSRSRHNLQYWILQPYLGFGAGAHGYYNHYRMENVTGIMEYIQSIENKNGKPFDFSPAELTRTSMSDWDEMQEFLMLGFRLTHEGISKAEFVASFHHSLEELFSVQLKLLLKSGLIEIHPTDGDRLRLTDRGVLFGNRVFEEFVGNKEPALLKIHGQ
jgi:oxygen-independent coproporphyrinogen-3 oxidase